MKNVLRCVFLAAVFMVALPTLTARAALPIRPLQMLKPSTTTTAAPPSTTSTTAPASDGRFHVVGRNVVDPDGKTVVLRGVNKSGLEYTPYGYDNDFVTFQRMKSWGANIVRLPLADAFGTQGMCKYDKTYLPTIDRIVSYAEQLKMVIVLDDHFATQGLPCGVGTWIGNQKAPDTYNLTFVKALATRYKNHPYVAIDLYNEPHDTNWDIWRNGGRVDNYTAVGMQQLLDGVRSTGFKNLLFATGAQWGNDLRVLANTPLRNDTDVIYGAHAYPYTCGARTVPPNEPYMCEGKQYAPFLDTQVAPAIATRPVMLTEFGTQRPIDGENRAVLQWSEDHGIGWMAWLWCNGKMTDYCLLTPDGQNTPSDIGKPVQDFLFQANGWTTLGGL
ncbi:MAG: endoglucanase [Actinomycetota bacterium]|jgi:hypothetical protein